jgi:hypothetical protein
MKILGLLLIPFSLFAQHDTIQVSKDKTVYLLFNSAVENVDTGTKQYAYKNTGNMVALKALDETSPVTSLMVQTKTDVFVWFIQYAKNPRSLLINLKNVEPQKPSALPTSKKPEVVLANANTSKTSNLGANSQPVVDDPRKIDFAEEPDIIRKRKKIGNRDSDIKDDKIQFNVNRFLSDHDVFYKDIAERSSGIHFSLYDMAIDKDHIYLKISITNTSSIAYDLDLITFERQHVSGIKRRETTGGDQLNVQAKESVKSIFPDQQETLVYVLQLYAFNEKDIVLVKTNELQGKRSLEFKIPAKSFINAKTITP